MVHDPGPCFSVGQAVGRDQGADQWGIVSFYLVVSKTGHDFKIAQVPADISTEPVGIPVGLAVGAAEIGNHLNVRSRAPDHAAAEGAEFIFFVLTEQRAKVAAREVGKEVPLDESSRHGDRIDHLHRKVVIVFRDLGGFLRDARRIRVRGHIEKCSSAEIKDRKGRQLEIDAQLLPGVINRRWDRKILGGGGAILKVGDSDFSGLRNPHGKAGAEDDVVLESVVLFRHGIQDARKTNGPSTESREGETAAKVSARADAVNLFHTPALVDGKTTRLDLGVGLGELVLKVSVGQIPAGFPIGGRLIGQVGPSPTIEMQ